MQGQAARRQETETFQAMTGAEYLESLRDGREIYIHGERVADVTTHPAFRNSARSVARLYDALHDSEHHDVLTGVDKWGTRTHEFFKPSYSPEELKRARDAIAAWSRMTYGFMGRTPDYKASFTATLGSYPEFYEPYTDNAFRWYQKVAERVLFLNHVIVNPPVDRHKPTHETRDVHLHVEKETDGGIVVSGAKMLATGSALTHATFVAHNSGSAATLEKGKSEDFAVVFMAPMETPGKKLISRESYEARASSPFDYPLSSRFDENDAVLIFDRAFIPWENVLVYRDVDKARGFYMQSGFVNRYPLQGATRLAVKLDYMSGLLLKGTASNGTNAFRGVRAQIGEVIAWRNLIWAITSAMALDPEQGPGGSVLPKAEYANLGRIFGTIAWPRVKEIFEQSLGGAPLVNPSSHKDLQSPELRRLIDQYYRGSDRSALDRVKLFNVVWDAIGTEFGGRHELYERNYSGNHEQIRLDALTAADQKGLVDMFQSFVDESMGDYDLDGWKTTWVS